MDDRDRDAVADMDDGELVVRLTRLVSTLDARSRAALLFALFPVASSVSEPATPRLLVAAVLRLRDDGTLRARVGAFLRERPHLIERIGGVKPGVRARRRELGIWAAAATTAILVAAFTALSSANDGKLERRHHRPTTLLVAQATPMAIEPPASTPLPGASAAALPPPDATEATLPPDASEAALPPPDASEAALPPPDASAAAPDDYAFPQAHAFRHSAPRKTSVAERRVREAPHRNQTDFHNIDFSGYFKKPNPPDAPTPAPSSPPSPKPRVHSLFGRLFGPRT